MPVTACRERVRPPPRGMLLGTPSRPACSLHCSPPPPLATRPLRSRTMRVSKAMRTLSVLSLAFLLAATGRASAQCRVCDQFFHCISSHPGALLCVEGPYTCAMFMGCFADDSGRGYVPDGPGDEFLTTWTLFDSESAPATGHAALRAAPGALAPGEEARASLGAP